MTGKQLQQRRKELGLSQTNLAQKLGTTQVTISRWESENLTIEKPEMLDLALQTLEMRYSETGKKRKTKRDG